MGVGDLYKKARGPGKPGMNWPFLCSWLLGLVFAASFAHFSFQTCCTVAELGPQSASVFHAWTHWNLLFSDGHVWAALAPSKTHPGWRGDHPLLISFQGTPAFLDWWWFLVNSFWKSWTKWLNTHVHYTVLVETEACSVLFSYLRLCVTVLNDAIFLVFYFFGFSCFFTRHHRFV